MSLNSALDNSLVVASKNQISSDLADETVILDLQSGQYYSLNQVATSIWKLIQQPRIVKDVRDELLAEYEVDLAQCNSDLQELLEMFADKGLVEFINQVAA